MKEVKKVIPSKEIYLKSVEGEIIKRYNEYQKDVSIQNVFTPAKLVHDMLKRVGSLEGKDVLIVANYDIAFRVALLKAVNNAPAYATDSTNEYNYKSLTFLTDVVDLNPKDETKFEVVLANLNEPAKIDMMGKKFDVVIGNPPYNTGEVGKNKTIYHKFLELGCKLSKGVSIMVTPGGYITSVGNKFKSTVEVMNNFGVSEIVYKDSKDIWPNLTIMDLNYSVLNVDSSNKVEDFKIVDERLEAIKEEGATHQNFLKLVRGGQAYEHSDCTSEERTAEFNTKHITRVNKNGPYKMYSNKAGYGAEYMVVMSERFSGLNPANVTVVKGDYSLSCNVIGLVFDSKDAAIRMAEYLTSEEIQNYIEAFKGPESNPFKLGVGRLIPDLTKESVAFTPATDYNFVD